ncbi:MAG: hypothetical protein MUF62_11455 [Chitinophagaceae bacterium]|jgi:hypothetical protein|nr:hypothetical protein [Chitinophagaceae bacterium]
MPSAPASPWSLSRLIGFRFFFVYLLLVFNPLEYLAIIPGLQQLLMWIMKPLMWMTEQLNKHWLKIADPLVMPAGSGDTSFGWANLVLNLLLALAAMLVWTLIARRRQHARLHYWFCLYLRYVLAFISFAYGFQKVLALQMPFPNMSQLATPLGDYLPMRLSWMFIGYSTPYQVFSGMAEVLVGSLLMWRRTTTLGILLAIAVYTNVAMLNLSYDIPVKIYSLHLLLISLVLAWQERHRLLAFFVLNKTAPPASLFQRQFTHRWARIGRIVAKTVFLLLAVGLMNVSTISYFFEIKDDYSKVLPPVKPGVYHVALSVKNGDTLAYNPMDSLQWKDFIFDYNGAGSVQTSDTIFRQRYRRGYFAYQPDSLGRSIAFSKRSGDEKPLFTLQLQQPDSLTMILSGRVRSDVVYLLLKRMPRHFQLAERQFHWLSEDNR